MNNYDNLIELAARIRRNVLDMTYNSGVNGGHLGGAFSSAEILAVLYGDVLNVNPKNPEDSNRDRFILSKGHCSIAHYAVLAERGFISHDDMMSFEHKESKFSTHETMNVQRGIEITSGSLGYGLSIGVGIALNANRKQLPYKTFVLMGDGECNEGTVWEAVMAAAKFKLNNLVAIVDVNGQSLDGYTKDVMPIYCIDEVWKNFGWNVVSVDGNSVVELKKAFQELSTEKPNVIIARTLKAKGLPTIEGQEGWHHARLSEEMYNNFVIELERSIS